MSEISIISYLFYMTNLFCLSLSVVLGTNNKNREDVTILHFFLLSDKKTTRRKARNHIKYYRIMLSGVIVVCWTNFCHNPTQARQKNTGIIMVSYGDNIQSVVHKRMIRYWFWWVVVVGDGESILVFYFVLLI